MSITELHGDTVTASQEERLREFTEALEPCELRTALYDLLGALRDHAVTELTTFDPWEHLADAETARRLTTVRGVA